MKLTAMMLGGFAVLAILAACSNNGSSPGAAPISPTEAPTNPVANSQPKPGFFSIRENGKRDLGPYVSGQNEAGIFCSLVNVPNSAFGKLIRLEAMWAWQSSDTLNKEYFRVQIEALSPRNIMPGKNKYDFIDSHVRMYKSKVRPVSFSEFADLPQITYGCDVANLERIDTDKKGQTLSGRILCYENNLYHKYSIRLNFSCTLN